MANKRDVRYGIDVVDELPEDNRTRQSVLEQALEAVKAQVEPGKWTVIARYIVPSAATAAANILRKRHGLPEVEGWEFKTRTVTEEDGERKGLFVSYDPGRIVQGADRDHAQKVAAEKQRLKEKRAKKAREKAKAEQAA